MPRPSRESIFEINFIMKIVNTNSLFSLNLGREINESVICLYTNHGNKSVSSEDAIAILASAGIDGFDGGNRHIGNVCGTIVKVVESSVFNGDKPGIWMKVEGHEPFTILQERQEWQRNHHSPSVSVSELFTNAPALLELANKNHNGRFAFWDELPKIRA